VVRTVALTAALLAAACAGEITATEIASDAGTPADARRPTGADADHRAPRLTLAQPGTGSAFVRDTLDARGALVARVPIVVVTEGPIARLEVLAGDALVGGDPPLVIEVDRDGPVEIRAIGYDADGQVVAGAAVTAIVEPPATTDCYDWLDLYHLDYTRGPSRRGVAEPVTVTTPINGIAYRYVDNASPRVHFFMDCQLARSLARAAPHLHDRDVVEVVDVGVYNYRCIGGGDPPDCPRGVSQHAYAKAIDLVGFVTADMTSYSVSDDWVIDADDEPTCTAPTETDADAWLHELICELKDDHVWNIVLTPNYNAGHRSHFHVDLKTGADYIRRTIDPELTPAADAASACGMR